MADKLLGIRNISIDFYIEIYKFKYIVPGFIIPVNCGGLFFGIRKRTLMGWRSELGGSPFANSMAVIPRLHTSAFAS